MEYMPTAGEIVLGPVRRLRIGFRGIDQVGGRIIAARSDSRLPESTRCLMCFR